MATATSKSSLNRSGWGVTWLAISTCWLCTKQHGVFLLLTHQRLKVPFVKRCAVAWKTRLRRKLCFNPRNLHPKNAFLTVHRQELRLSYLLFLTALKSSTHCFIPRFISLHIGDVVCWHNTSRKAKTFSMHWTTLEGFPRGIGHCVIPFN